MSKKEVRETNDKMALVAAVAEKWPKIGRNAILGFKMDSMRAALLTGDPGALEAPERGAAPCAHARCDSDRLKGHAVCKDHLAAYRKKAKD
jgi:hypothetical protein